MRQVIIYRLTRLHLIVLDEEGDQMGNDKKLKIDNTSILYISIQGPGHPTL